MKKHLLLYFILLLFISVYGQEYHQADSYLFDANKTGWHIYEAKNSVTLSPGFSYSAINTESFTGKVNEKILFPDMSNAYLKEDGTTTDDPTLGCAVGAIPGQFNVSVSGAATYTIPIEVPPGVNGMQPNIALNYNSQAGDGVAGLGWNISGLSSITRVPRTLYHDGRVEGIRWTKEDALALDGNRLLIIEEYGWSLFPDSVEYKTEVDNGSKIMGYNYDLKGPRSFIVTTKDGKKVEYTATGYEINWETNVLNHYDYPESIDDMTAYSKSLMTFVQELYNEDRYRDTTDCFEWKIKRITDVYGNFIEYNYEIETSYSQYERIVGAAHGYVACDYGSCYYGISDEDIDTISDVLTRYLLRHEFFEPDPNDNILSDVANYNGTHDIVEHTRVEHSILSKGDFISNVTYGHGNDEVARVEFYYEDREQDVSGYIYGHKKTLDVRLDSIGVISMSDNSDQLLRTYSLDYTDRDMLYSLGIEAENNVKLKETTFEYYEDLGQLERDYFILEDLAGNLPAGSAFDEGRVINSISANFDEDTELEKLVVFRFVDIDWYNIYNPFDNRNKIERTGYYIGLYDDVASGNTLLATKSISENQSNNYIVNDKDRDGINELYLQEAAGTGIIDSVEVYDDIWVSQELYDVNFTGLVYNNSSFVVESQDKLYDIWDFNTPTSFDNIVLQGDFNGDGNLDVVISDDNDNLYIPNSSISLNAIPFSTDNKIQLTTDINGNGKQEVFLFSKIDGKHEIYEYNGTTFERINSDFQVFDKSMSLHPGDFNGDGNTDILSYSEDYDQWYIHYSTGTFLLGKEAVSLGTTTRVIDIYGYGVLEDEVGSYTRVKDLNNDGKQDVVQAYPLWKDENYDKNRALYVYYSLEGDDFVKKDSVVFDVSDIEYFSLADGDYYNSGLTYYYRQEIDYKETSEHSKRSFWEIMRVYSPISDLSFTNSSSYNKMSIIRSTIGDSVLISYREDNLKGLKVNELNSSADESLVGTVKGYNKNILLGLVDTIKTAGSLNVYGFDEPSINYLGRGFLGYKKTSTKDLISNVIVLNEQRLDEDYHTLLPSLSLTYKNETLIGESEQYYRSLPLGGKRYRVIADSIIQLNHLNNTGLKTTYESYDDDGNLTNSIKEYYDGDDIISDYYQKTTFNYTDEGSWGIKYLPSSIINIISRGEESEKKITTFSYNSNGSLHTKTSAPDSTFEVVTSFNSYDAYGNVKSITNSTPNDINISSQTKTINYTDDGRFVQSETSGGMTTTYQYDLAKSQLIATTAPSGLTTRYFYNDLGKKYKVLSPAGVESYSMINWIGNDSDAPSGALYYIISKTSGIAETRSYYNAKGQDLRTLSYGFNGEKVYADKEYDIKDRLFRESLPYFKGESKQWTTYSYNDAYDRLTEVTASDGTISKTIYDDANRKVTSQVIKGGITQSGTRYSNALGQVETSEDNLGNKVHYVYNVAGRLKESWVNDMTQHKTSFMYDSRGNRLSITDPDAGTITNTYDALGRARTQTNARGHYSTYDYDELGRVHTQITKESINGAQLESLEYDYLSTGVAIGQLNWIKQDGSLKESYSYDVLGRLNAKTEYVDDQSFTHSHTFDDYSRVDKLIYPSGYEIQNVYNERGDLWQIISNNQVIYENTDYSALGALEGYNIGSKNVTFHYDATGRLDYQGCASVQSTNYAYDEMNNLEHRIDDKFNQKEYFSYDNLNRLTNTYSDASKTLAKESINYDATGNIISKTGVGANMVYGENGKPHALTSINTPMGYQPPNQEIEYTYFNKALSVDQDNGAYTYDYSYGVDHQRRKTVYKEGGSIKRTKYYLGNYEKEIDRLGNVKEYHYLSADVGLFGIFVETNGGNGELKYVLSDHLGSLTKILDTNGNLEQSYSYDAWGNIRNASNWSQSQSGAGLLANRGFTGHEHLPSIFGLIDMNGRMYDPVLGRFLSPDPYVQAPGYAQNFNRYAYCINNPLIYTDPTGEIIPFLIPSMSYSEQGGLEVSLTFGAGLTEMLSASKTIGYNFKSGDYYLTNNVQFGPLYAYYGTHSDAGFIAGAGVGFNPFGSTGLSTNLTSTGINWSQKYGVSYNCLGWDIDKNGNSSFNPSIGYSYDFSILSYESGVSLLASNDDDFIYDGGWRKEVIVSPYGIDDDYLYYFGMQKSWQSEYREYYNDYKKQQWAAQEQAQLDAMVRHIHSGTNKAANIIAGTGGVVFAGLALASVPAATYATIGGGIKSGAVATVKTASKIYKISSKTANLYNARLVDLSIDTYGLVVNFAIDIQAAMGIGVGFLNNRGANITTGLPLVDYSAAATQFAIQAYEFSY